MTFLIYLLVIQMSHSVFIFGPLIKISDAPRQLQIHWLDTSISKVNNHLLSLVDLFKSLFPSVSLPCMNSTPNSQKSTSTVLNHVASQLKLSSR